MRAEAVAVDPVSTGWSALRVFFSEGAEALQRATVAFEAAESEVRASGDSSRHILWLLGLSTALRHSRRPEPMEEGLARARELVNLTARILGEEATVPYRTHVEDFYRDLADVVPAQADGFLEAGLDYSDRTMRLARRGRRDEWIAAAAASRGDLVLRAGRPADRRAIRRAIALHKEARRRWPAGHRDGRAQVGLGYAETLLCDGRAGEAEGIAREALAVFIAGGDRYHEAAARLILARVLFALDRSEALDEHAAAVALFRTLGCRWELARAQEALA